MSPVDRLLILVWVMDVATCTYQRGHQITAATVVPECPTAATDDDGYQTKPLREGGWMTTTDPAPP